MNRVKAILNRIFCLPPLLTVLISVPSYAAVIYVLAAGREGTIGSYISYGASAYAFIITAAGIPRMVRSARQTIVNNRIIGTVRKSRMGNRVLKDTMFRTEISLYQGLFINLLYAVWKLASGIHYHSLWFGALAVYYILLAWMRFLLLRHVNKNEGRQNLRAELHRYRLCGILLLFINQALACIVILVVYQNNGFEYPGVFIYVMALYAFYTVITAVMNVIKCRRYGSPVMSAAKVINLTAALVSMLSLETAMLTQFDEVNDPVFRQIMTGATGAAVCVLVLTMAVFMICRATKQLNLLGGSISYGREKGNI